MDATPYLVAMAGGSGSGKSTLVEALTARLAPRVAVIHEDAYYWPMSHYGDARTEAARAALAEQINYDDPASKDGAALCADLQRLKAGEPVEIPVYDYARHDRSRETRRVEPARVILLEGIHALSLPHLAPLIDLSIYVDTPDDLRLARRIRRDVVERGRSVEGVLSQYLGTVRPAHYRHTFPAKFSAGLVIADEGLPAYGHVRPTNAAVERMLAPILKRLESDGVMASAP